MSAVEADTKSQQYAGQDFDTIPSVHPHFGLDSSKAATEDLDEKKLDGDHHQTTLDIASVDEHYVPGDPLPMDANLPEETNQFTVRAVFVGCAIGAVVQASNLYLGLKTGITFGPQLLGGIGGFLVLKPLSRVIPKALPAWFGTGYFGPKENVTVQSAATAAGGLGILFVSGFPAMYQLGLMGATPKEDFGKLIGFMFAVAFYGMTFAVPLRSFFILRQRLTFPTPTATAYAIRSLHATGAAGAADAKAKAKWLGWTFLVAFIQKTVSTYIPCIIYDWHFFYWIATWGAPKAQLIDNWGWFFEITPAFFGAGILSGTNASFSFYGGSILAWAIIGPALVATGRAAGKDTSEPGGLPYRSYYSMNNPNPSGTNASPRYNLLWMGVLILLVCAFVELFCEWRAIASGFSPLILAVRNRVRARRGKEMLESSGPPPLKDPAPKRDQVPWWVWVPITLIAVVVTCIVQGIGFKVNVGLSILAVILAAMFSFIGVLCAGLTDFNPVTSCAKASQLIFGGVTHGKYMDSVNPVTGYNTHALNVNLLSGLVAAGAAAQASDLTGDLKTGHLIGAKPVSQYFAQLIGAFVSCFLCPAFFLLFTTAAPCILELDAEVCQYQVPSAGAWYAVAIGVTTTSGLPVPTTAGILAIVLTIIGVALIVFRVFFCPAKYKSMVPNPTAVGLAFVLNATHYSFAMAVGASIAIIWRKKAPAHFEKAGFAAAAGMIAGEGIGGVMQAILYIANAGTDKALTTGCPG